MYVTTIRKIISSYDVVADESFSSALAYTSRPYSESMAMRPAMTYTPCATSLRKQTCDIIMFPQFDKWGLLYETRNYTESGSEPDDHSIIPPLLSEE